MIRTEGNRICPPLFPFSVSMRGENPRIEIINLRLAEDELRKDVTLEGLTEPKRTELNSKLGLMMPRASIKQHLLAESSEEDKIISTR